MMHRSLGRKYGIITWSEHGIKDEVLEKMGEKAHLYLTSKRKISRIHNKECL